MEVSKRFQELLLTLRNFLLKPREISGEYYKKNSPEFSAFSVLNLLENQISSMIAELLNPEGSHAQGKIFLDLFIKDLASDAFDNGLPRKYEKATVTREFPIKEYTKEEGRIDILVDFNNIYGLAIENKPFANDQDTQSLRYAQALIQKYGEDKFILFYLNTFGTPPSENSMPSEAREKLGRRFRVIKYKEISEWLDKCAEAAKKNQANRLSETIKEFSFFINKDFYKENIIINELIGKEIEEHILEAYELHLLWKSNDNQLRELWRKKVNYLFNEVLPELVFKQLKESGIVDENWEYIKGNFDIDKLHLRGFKIKKKTWKHFSVGVLSDRFEREAGKRSFFPVILSEKEIRRHDYMKEYNEATGCKPLEIQVLKSPAAQWFADFPDPKYIIWGYEQWAGIREDGDTVNYVADFLAKLIKACAADIDEEEKRLQF